jgi:hypothetical protein
MFLSLLISADIIVSEPSTNLCAIGRLVSSSLEAEWPKPALAWRTIRWLTSCGIFKIARILPVEEPPEHF